MTYTFSKAADAVEFFGNTEAVSFGCDEAVSSDAFDFAFDEEGCLKSYWVATGDGSFEKIFTARGEAAFEATASAAEEITGSTGGLLATDFGLDSYNTWKA